MRTEAVLLTALLSGCVTTTFKPCGDDPTSCGADAYCHPSTLLCERIPDVPLDFAMPDMAMCRVQFVNGTTVPTLNGVDADNLVIADLNKDKYGDLIYFDTNGNDIDVALGMNG